MPEYLLDVGNGNVKNTDKNLIRRIPLGRLLFATGGMLLLTLLMAVSAHAQKSDGEQKNSLPGASKPAQPSASNPSASKPGKITLYPASAQETADAILADSLGRIYDQADEHFHHGEYNHIYNLNRIVVQGDPHNVEAYSNSAYYMWSSDRGEEAIAFLKQGIKANPNTYYMYDELGTYYWLHLKDAVSAIPYYEQAIKFKCPFFTLNLLAYCYEKTGAWDKAVATWRTATQFRDNPQAERHLAHAIAERDKRSKQ
jgi:tetratricopeptide (TPR) repeat protein